MALNPHKKVHYEKLTGNWPRHPFGGTHYPVEVSFNSIRGGWIRLRNSVGDVLDISPEEAIELAHRVIQQHPLDALARIRPDEED